MKGTSLFNDLIERRPEFTFCTQLTEQRHRMLALEVLLRHLQRRRLPFGGLPFLLLSLRRLKRRGAVIPVDSIEKLDSPLHWQLIHACRALLRAAMAAASRSSPFPAPRRASSPFSVTNASPFHQTPAPFVSADPILLSPGNDSKQQMRQISKGKLGSMRREEKTDR